MANLFTTINQPENRYSLRRQVLRNLMEVPFKSLITDEEWQRWNTRLKTDAAATLEEILPKLIAKEVVYCSHLDAIRLLFLTFKTLDNTFLTDIQNMPRQITFNFDEKHQEI